MTEKEQNPDAVDAIYDQLRGEGKAEAGRFTLERSKAKEKLKEFLLSDPYAYVLLFVRAAVKQGASKIDFTFRKGSLEMTFDGKGYTSADLEKMYDAVFDASVNQALPGLRELALGANTAEGLSFEVDMAPLGDRTRIRVNGKVGKFEWIPQGDACRPEEHLVRKRCRFAPIPVHVNGKNIADPSWRARDAVAATSFSKKGVEIHAGFLPLERIRGAVLFLMDGVVTAEESIDAGDCGFTAVVQSDGLQLDASESKVVRNEAFQQAMVAARIGWGKVFSKKNFNACHNLVAFRAQEELKRFTLGHRIRQGVFWASTFLMGWAASVIVIMFILKNRDLVRRLLDSMLLSLFTGTLSGAILFGTILHSTLVVNPGARRFNRLYPPGSPVREAIKTLSLGKISVVYSAARQLAEQ